MSTIHFRLDRIIGELLDADMPLEQALEQFEIKYIQAALLRRRKNKTQAARLLGVHRNTLMNLLKRYGR